jgi:lysophospholipid acyltransferase (LPLAT)-like uncharacterized protein
MPGRFAHAKWVISALTLIVCITWLITFAARILHHSYEGSAAVDTAMLLLLGFWFGTSALSSRKEEDAA